MNNLIKYYYNLDIDELKEYSEYSIFKCNNEIYIFKKYKMDMKKTQYIIDVLFKNNINVHKIIINKDNELLTKYNNFDYILLMINSNTIIEDILINIPVKELDVVDIGLLWSNKIDNYIDNLNSLGFGKRILIDTFNYYVGLAENAISLYNDANLIDENINYYICHKRMYYPNYSINFLDPTNMLIDSRIRDIGEFIKYKFFYNDFSILEFDIIIKKYNLTIKEMNLLYARLFFPTYYFDVFEDNIINREEKELLIKIYEKRTLYEKFLYEIYLKYRNTYNLKFVEWISINQR